MKSCMFVVPSLSDGGAERVVSILSSELSNMINSVYVLVYWDTEFNYAVDEKVHVINLSGGDKETYDHIKATERLKKIRAIIVSEQPEVVIPFLPHVCLHVSMATIGLRGCSVIQTVRNNPAISPPEKSRRFLRNALIRLSKCTIVQNEEQKKYFPESQRKKLHILPNPVNEEFFTQTFQPPQDGFKVVAVGRIIGQKNYALLVDAFEKFAQNHSNAVLDIYGDGHLKDSFEKQVIQKGLDSKINFKGRSNKIPEILAGSSLFVMTSDFEGMPNSLMEAMAIGIPVISTDCPTGPKDLIGNNERGMLVPVSDQDALLEGLEEIYQNYDRWKEKGLLASQYIESRYRQNGIARQLVEICSMAEGN